jgi:putative ABC transport system permease protein
MGNLLQDLRYALRTFRKSPLFVAVALLSLAFGIGANTAIFTLVDQVLLRLLPVKDPRQLVLLWGRGPHYGSNNGRYKLSYPMYKDISANNQVFSGMFARANTSMSVSAEGKTERIEGELVSGTYFPVLGVGAALGRVFTPDDDQTPGGHPLAVISYRYWVSRFARNSNVIGKKILVNGYPLTIIGVSQDGFDGTNPGYAPQIRVPLMMNNEIDPVGSTFDNNFTSRRRRWINVFGRLKPGVTAQQAKASLQPFFHQMLEMEVREKAFARAAPETRQRFLTMWIDVLPASKGDSNLRRQFSSALLVLTAIVGLVLLIACANVANLLIARATARQREIAIRLALGASRSRIISQLLIESLTLAAAGGMAGLLLAIWMDQALLGFLPASDAPLDISTTPDARILLFTLGVSLFTGIVFGLAPALQSTRPRLAGTLKEQVGSIAGGASVGIRKTLVVAQVTLSLLLLIGASLFIRSLSNLKDLDPGFKIGNLLQFSVNPTMSGYKPERSLDFYRQLRENLDAIPGVESAALAVMPVLADSEWDNSMAVEGFAHKPGNTPDPHMQFITPDFFKTMHIPILAGRDFRMSDAKGAPEVCIVNEKFAKQYFKDGNAVGRHVGMGGDPGTKLNIEIVGVVGDTKYENMREEVPIEVYQPYHQVPFVLGMMGYVRTARPPEQAFSTIRRVVSGLDPNLPVANMETLEKQQQESLITERLVATLSAGFGILATLLAAIGVYGVMAYLVAQRTREIGVRMALGAATGDVVWLVMKEVLLLAGIGIAIGLPAALALTKFAKAQLFGIQPNDALSIAIATLAIAMVAVLSGYIPARRATLVDPMRALRWE